MRLHSLLALLATSLAAAPAMGAGLTHIVTVDGRSPDAEVLIPRFDSALGQLERVRITLQVDVAGGLGFENLGSAPNLVSADFGAYARVLAPGGAALVEAQTPPIECDHVLAPFDGTVDLAGASGASFSGLGASASEERSIDADPFWIHGFVGTAQTIALTVETIDTTQITGSGRLAVRRGQVMTTVLVVDYEYTPYED